MGLTKLCHERVELHAEDAVLYAIKNNKVEKLTYKQLDEQAKNLAYVLVSKGFQDSRALIALDNSVDCFVAIIGCLYAKITPMLFPYDKKQTTHNEIVNVALITNPKVILADRKTGDIKDVCWVNAHKAEHTVCESPLQIEDDPSQEIIIYHFNSIDKGAAIRLRVNDLIHNASTLYRTMHINKTNRAMASYYPLYTEEGLMVGLVLPIVADSYSWLCHFKEIEESPINFLKLISIKKIAIATLDSKVLIDCQKNMCSKDLAELDFDLWQVALNTETDIDIQGIEEAKHYFFATGLDPYTFFPTYGRREFGLCATGRKAHTPIVKLYLNKHELCKGQAEIVHMSHPDNIALCSKGKALTGYQINVVRGETQALCQPYEVGEVKIASDYMTPGYLDNPRLNKRYFEINSKKKAQLLTGHLGFLDEHGELFITGTVADIAMINGVFINIKTFKESLVKFCEDLNENQLIIIKEQKENKKDRLVILLETKIAGTQLTNLYDQIIEVATRDIEINGIFIAVFKPNMLPHVNEIIDIEACIEGWHNKSLVPEASWQLMLSSQQMAGKKGIISLVGLSDKRKSEKLKAWLHAWLALKIGYIEDDINENRHLAFYGFSYVNIIHLAHEIYLIFNQWVHPSVIWEFNNIKALTHFLFSEAFLDDANPTPAVSSNQDTPVTICSHNEQEWYQLAEAMPENSALYCYQAILLHGRFNLKAFEQSLITLIERHPILKTGYQLLDSQLQRRIKATFSPSFELIDLSELSSEEQKVTLKTMQESMQKEHLTELSKPLWRVFCYKIDTRTHKLIFNYHQMIIDYWSMRIILRDLSQCYNAEIQGYASKLPEDKIQYGDYAQWVHTCLNEENFMFQSFYWEHRLENVQALYLPYDDKPGRTLKPESAFLYFNLNGDITNKLKATAMKNQVDLYTLFLSAYQILLFWLSNEENITVRCNHCNRHQKELIDLVGNLQNYFLLQEDVFARASAEDLFAVNREALARSCQSFDIPYPEVLALLDEEIQLSMPNAAFEFHEFPQQFHFEDINIEERNFDFAFDHMPDDTVTILMHHQFHHDSIDCRFHFRLPYFTHETAKLITQKYTEIISSIMENAHMPIQHICGPSYAEMYQTEE